MAQNVTIAGAAYPAVPSIIVPKTGGGTAPFFDVSDTTAVAADVLSGKYFYTSAGVRTAGTGSGVSAYAYIVVQYSAGATLSCTNCEDIIDLSSSMALILVWDNATSCVVSAVQSGVTTSKTVSVEEGGAYYITVYNMVIFVYNGVIQGSNMSLKGSKDASAAYNQAPTVTYATGYVDILAGGSGTYNGSGIAYFPETINLARYSTLHVQGTARNNTNGVNFCAADVWHSTPTSTQSEYRRVLQPCLSSSSVSSYTSFSITADLSTYTDSAAYVGFNVRRNNQGYSGIRLTYVWVD